MDAFLNVIEVIGAFGVGNVVVAAINVFIFFYQQHANKKVRKLILKDDFWFRTLILPDVIKPTQEFLETQSSKLSKVKKKSSNTFQLHWKNEFGPANRTAITKCNTLRIYSYSLYNDVAKIFDELETEVVNFCFEQDKGKTSSRDMQAIFSNTNIRIIKTIKDFHEKHLFK